MVLFFSITNSLILIATIAAIYFSPIKAVKVGRQLTDEQQKDNAKRNLFLLLFSLRGTPVHFDFVKGLNQIDIVFEDNQTVLDAWHIHYDSLQIKGQVNQEQIWDLQRANLLSAMAVCLGYKRIKQTDMIRSYYPEGHQYLSQYDNDFRVAVLKYLKSGHEVFETALLGMPPKTTENTDVKTQ